MKASSLLPLALLSVLALAAPASASIHINDLTGKPLTVPAPRAKATVLLFVSSVCPYSNSAAPEMAQIAKTYSPRGFEFLFVYGNGFETKAGAIKHARDYGFSLHPVLDKSQALVRAAGATNTPETAVISSTGKMLYRGRIDNRFSSIGVQRTLVTQHDLTDALDAISAGKAPPHSFEQPVGCSIELTSR